MFRQGNTAWLNSRRKEEENKERVKRLKSIDQLEMDISNLQDELFTLDTVAGLATALSAKIKQLIIRAETMYVTFI